MLSTRKSNKAAEAHQLDRIFRALGDRTRRQLVRRLAKGPSTISELARPFRMSLPAVSKHLRVLERAGLIERRVDGRTHHCRLSAAPLSRVDEWMAYYRQFWDETLERFSDHLTRDTD